jgi:hypothetical protein
VVNRENIKKISRLSYVIILFVCSYLFFIGNGSSYYSTAGQPVQRGLTSIFTEHYFLSCRIEKISAGQMIIDGGRPLILQRPSFEKRCSGKEKSIEIDNVIIFPNTTINPQQSESFTKFNNNPDRKYTYEYSNNRDDAYKKSEKITEVIMWIVFFLTIPLIWFTRDFSIHIVNFSISLVSKGWKKL